MDAGCTCEYLGSFLQGGFCLWCAVWCVRGAGLGVVMVVMVMVIGNERRVRVRSLTATYIYLF